jgi:PAS domain-containing protein
MENKSLPERVEISEEVLFQDIEGECVLLNLANEQYFGLDEVGTRFWELLSENNEIEPILRQILNEFNVEESVLRRDLVILLDEMSENGLIINH